MVRKYRESDLSEVMEIWLDTNIKSHNFISKEYWENNYEMVYSILPEAEVYVYEADTTKYIEGFIGMSGDYIEGLFVRGKAQSQGIGLKLLDYAKGIRATLQLSVYQKNVRAVQFYKRENFRIQSKKNDVNTGEDQIIMIWNR